MAQKTLSFKIDEIENTGLYATCNWLTRVIGRQGYGLHKNKMRIIKILNYSKVYIDIQVGGINKKN